MMYRGRRWLRHRPRSIVNRAFDQAHLRSEAYVDSSRLETRRSLYRYAVPRVSFPTWALGHLAESSVGSVLDVGCGNGTYLAHLARTHHLELLVGVDLSVGMIVEALGGWNAEPRFQLLVADAQALPFGDSCFDTLLCMHVLFHVPNIDVAVAEFRRVLRREGVLLVSTNGRDHQRPLREMFDDTVEEIGGKKLPGPVLSSGRRFRLEDAGGVLSRHFQEVALDSINQDLVIPEVDPVLEYLESIRSFHETNLPAGVTWESVMAVIQRKVAEAIEVDGSFRSRRHAGVLVCR